jgi:DNA (cytosine-5)-methyltransferase 1
MLMPIALDLFCCQGGASHGLTAAGFTVIGVDIEPQPNYPFPFIRADAIMTLPCGFDFVWASPPCQAHTRAQRIQGRNHPELIESTREMLRACGTTYVIENVVGAPLENPVMLCGGMFNLLTYRHRLFECSFPVKQPHHPEHQAPNRKMGRPVREGEAMHIVGNFSGVQKARDIMGLQWMSRDGLREAIPPKFAEYIGRAALAHMRRSASSKPKLEHLNAIA